MSYGIDALKTLEQFHYRAREILQSRFANRADLDKVGVTLTATAQPDGTFVIQTPAVDSDDALAAYTRLRPLQLPGDPVHHRKVMNAIGYLAKDEHPDLRQHIKDLASAWQQWPVPRWSYIDQTGSIDDVALANAYLYGAGVHADADKVELLQRVAHNHSVLIAVAGATRDGILLTRETVGIVRRVAPTVAT